MFKVKSKSTKQIVLPNGMQAFCLDRGEAQIVFKQVQEYLQHGIELKPGDTVFDVGANIGLFSLWLHHEFRTLNLYAFEPVPDIFQVLAKNACLASGQLQVFPFGLSDRSRTISFAYYPNATPLSTVYLEAEPADRANLRQAILSNLGDISSDLKKIKRLPAFLRSFILDRILDKVLQVVQVDCELRTLSEVIRVQKIQSIELLKIDVERSELDVLLGIEGVDWQKIHQIVVEVHDLEGRVQTIVDLLEQHEFKRIVVEQERMLQDTNIYNIYALKN